VNVARANPLRRLPWALFLLALAAWIGLAWRRPRPAPRDRTRRASAQGVVQPAIVWQPADGRAEGWIGRVIDAHDESPIAGARIEVVTAAGAVSASSDADGLFRLEPATNVVDGVLSVSAPWHSRLERPLPPPGRLSVALATRRRALLGRLVELAAGARRGTEVGEPTPDEVARQAADAARADTAAWARAVEGAAYGPDPVDAEREAAVSALEPRDR
jgi:hypothetical protein